MGKNYLYSLVKEFEFWGFFLFVLVYLFVFAVVASYNVFNKKNIFMCSEKTVW